MTPFDDVPTIAIGRITGWSPGRVAALVVTDDRGASVAILARVSRTRSGSAFSTAMLGRWAERQERVRIDRSPAAHDPNRAAVILGLNRLYVSVLAVDYEVPVEV